MKVRVREPQLVNNTMQMVDIETCDICVGQFSALGIDGSTSNTGIAIIDESSSIIRYTMSVAREKDETPVQYKIRLKRLVTDILRKNRTIMDIGYEEPIVENIGAVKNLFMLRVFVEEIIEENRPEFDYIRFVEIPNMTWKKKMLGTEKVPSGTEAQKKAIRDKVVSCINYMDGLTEDEYDAIGITAVMCKVKQDGQEIDELKAKKKAKPFQYNVEFIGADDEDNMVTELMDLDNIPDKVMNNGILLKEINKRSNFDKCVYEYMGSEDKVVIIKMDTRWFGDVILKYKLGELASTYMYIYAIIWRKTRKI
jgi:Holliday junction resolvasome RuvABC endonuclease subunit